MEPDANHPKDKSVLRKYLVPPIAFWLLLITSAICMLIATLNENATLFFLSATFAVSCATPLISRRIPKPWDFGRSCSELTSIHEKMELPLGNSPQSKDLLPDHSVESPKSELVDNSNSLFGNDYQESDIQKEPRSRNK